MKNLFILLSILILMVACAHSDHKNTAANKPENTTKNDTIFKDDRDTVVIDSEDEYKETKRQLKQLIIKNPEFGDDLVMSPEIAYFKQDNMNEFGSEAGQDSYYIIYAYFLRQRQLDKVSNVKRSRLIKMYRNINSIFDALAQGGTYFGHQHKRILGEAEYSIYQGKDNYYYKKAYDITKQKELYLNTLKQQIVDELSTGEFLEKEKPKIKKELFETVNELDTLITDYFYLESARTFQYSNY